ncbi:MAG TPA: permease prefix domain 1-containing protein [Phycisphaerae bacterium]|nr:permease prefix domain 1-containing protein [Phycisphaerae bacterium]
MHSVEFEAYLALLSRFLRLTAAQREDIRRELRSHLDDALEAEMAQGLTREQAVLRVLEDFGDAAELAHRFGRRHRARRWIMQGTLAAACLGVLAIGVSLLLPTGTSPLRAQDGALAAAQSPQSAAPASETALNAALQRRVPEIRFEDAPLEAVRAWVAEMTQCNVVILWTALEECGIDRDRPITVTLRDVSIDTLLQVVFADVRPRLYFDYIDNVLVIGPAERTRLVVRAYDVRDLLDDAGAAPPAASRAESPDEQDQALESDTPEVRRLLGLVTDTVYPDTWENNGGMGTIRAFRKAIVVRNHAWVHREVRDLLEQLRAAGAPTR